MKKTLLATIICITSVSGYAASPKASAYLVKDLTTGKILVSKNANTQKPIASLTKLMTAMVVLDSKLPSQEMIRVDDADVDNYKHSSSRLAVGTLLYRDQMLHLALMSSENRAAHSLSRNYPGGTQKFVQDMNLKAKQLGMHNTRFVDPTGLSEQNISTAEDLAIMVEAASKYTKIKQFSTDKEEEVHSKKYMNSNPLARGDNSWPLMVSKTGFTQEAGRCLVMNTLIKNKQTAMIILDSPSKENRTRDAQQLKQLASGSTKIAESNKKHTKNT